MRRCGWTVRLRHCEEHLATKQSSFLTRAKMDCFADARNDGSAAAFSRHGREARSQLRATSRPSTFFPSISERTWMPGTRPGMTQEVAISGKGVETSEARSQVALLLIPPPRSVGRVARSAGWGAFVCGWKHPHPTHRSLHSRCATLPMLRGGGIRKRDRAADRGSCVWSSLRGASGDEAIQLS